MNSRLKEFQPLVLSKKFKNAFLHLSRNDRSRKWPGPLDSISKAFSIGNQQKMIDYFSGNFTIEESKTLIEEEMICLDQYYHHQQASMSTAAFIMIVLVCSLLTGVVVFAVLNFLWKKFRSRRFDENRSAPRTARDEEVYIAGQKT